jgi:hypothetical protein
LLFAALLGGRSLRYTAEVVYGRSSMFGGGMKHENEKEMAAEAEQLRELVLGRWGSLVEGNGSSLFDDVGGVDLWRKLHRNLPTKYDIMMC